MGTSQWLTQPTKQQSERRKRRRWTSDRGKLCPKVARPQVVLGTHKRPKGWKKMPRGKKKQGGGQTRGTPLKAKTVKGQPLRAKKDGPLAMAKMKAG